MRVHAIAGYLDKSFELLAGKATVAIEALALAITIIEATVGALSELGKIAEVLVVVDLSNSNSGRSGSNTSRHGERTGAVKSSVDFDEVLNTSLAGLVSKLNIEVHVGGRACHALTCTYGSGGVLAVVGAVLGVRVVTGVGSLEAGEVLDTVVEAVASLYVNGGCDTSHLDAFEDFVGKGAEGVLDTGTEDIVVGGGVDSVSAPDAAIGIVVDHDELLISKGGSAGGSSDLEGLLHHVGLDGGEGVVALGGHAVGAIGTVVAKVASAALNLLSIPKLVDVAVLDVGVGMSRDDVGSDEVADGTRGGLGGELKLGRAG